MSFSPSLKITAVSVPKASDVLAERLRELIFEERLPEGTPLPSERELVAKSGLSRTSVREALRVLETEGLIATRAGRNGGSVVRRPSRESVSRSIELFLRSHGVRFEALVEAREAVEPAAARLAALHRTDAEVAELLGIQDALEAVSDDVRRFVKLNLQWHGAVVNASRNELLMTFFEALSNPLRAATEYQGLNTRELRDEIIKVHRRVIDAIVTRDQDAAFRRMARHIGAYSRMVHRLASEESVRLSLQGSTGGSE